MCGLLYLTSDTLQPSTYKTLATYITYTLWYETFMSPFHRWRHWCSQQHLFFKQSDRHATLNNVWSSWHHWSHFKPLIVHSPSTSSSKLWQRIQLFPISPEHEEEDDHVLNTHSACMLLGSHGLKPWWLWCLLSRTMETFSEFMKNWLNTSTWSETILIGILILEFQVFSRSLEAYLSLH